MTDAPTTPVLPVGDTIQCNECRYEVPALDYCVRCVDPLAEEKRHVATLTGRRTQFAAQPA